MAARRLSPEIVWRRRAAALLIAGAMLLAGYHLWFRDSSLVAVEDVKVEGVSTNQEQIAAALQGAADGMTTLHIDDDQLREAASAFPTVASVSADADLLHSLTITVTERLPVARVGSRGETVAVSADGYLLPGVGAEGLPPLEASAEGTRLDAEGISQSEIVGGAPAELREQISSVTWDPDRGGVIVEIDGAPELRFGDGERAEDKWKAVATVLASPDPGSPAYADVSVPDRPVTGG